LVYGDEAVSPLEATMVSPRVQAYDEAVQDQLQRDDVDLVDKTRWQAAPRNAWYRQVLRSYHQWFVHSRQLQVDDLVLRRILSREGMHKLPATGRVLFG
jgi:hypothetical protein